MQEALLSQVTAIKHHHCRLTNNMRMEMKLFQGVISHGTCYLMWTTFLQKYFFLNNLYVITSFLKEQITGLINQQLWEL